MIVLGIETSGPVGSVALCEDGSALASHTFPHGARHARDLVPAVERVVARAGIGREDVGAVAVSQGPGSFTGLRVGVTCAKTLAWALGWRAVGVPSLEVQVQNVDPDERGARQACPVQDARRGAVYATLFEWDEGRWRDRTGVLLKEPDALADRLPEGAFLFGSGVDAYPELFCGPRFRIGPRELSVGRAEAVAALGRRLLAEGRDVDPMELLPKYHRLTAPEAKLKGEQAG